MRILFVAFVLSVCVRAALPPGYTLPIIDLAGEKDRQIIVDREPGQYLGHPTTALLDDGKTIVAVYPKGHGKGPIVMKRSRDGGWTWSERLPVPESWSTSQETPTIHRVVNAAGLNRLILWSGLYPARFATSKLLERGEEQWSELTPAGDWGGIVVMSCLEPLKTDEGHYLAMFHDDGRYFSAEARQENPPVFTLYKTFSRDGGLTWSKPEAVFARSDVQLCEPGAIRSPDGKQLAILLRENSRRLNSHVIFSDDEGATCSEPRELPAALTGDRHVGRYTPDGRLFISFRDTTRESPTKGDWVAWVGKYEDIVAGREGQYRVRLMDNTKDVDCAYPGVEVLSNGAIVATTYGHWEQGEEPYIVSVRLTMDELDARAAIAAPEDDASKAARERAEGAARLIDFIPIESLIWNRWQPNPDAPPRATQTFEAFHKYVSGELRTPPSAIAPLLRHSEGKVRALALSALFHREDPHLLPLIATCREDARVVATEDADRLESLHTLVERMLSSYVDERSAEVPPESFRHYWEERHLRAHSASWSAMRLRRAAAAITPSSEDRSTQIAEALKSVGLLPAIDRALTLWYMARLQRPSLPVPEAELVEAFRSLEPEQLIELMQGKQLTADPDIYPPQFKHALSVPDGSPLRLTRDTLPAWLFASVSKFLPKSSAPELLDAYEASIRPLARDQYGANLPVRWLIAAATLDPEYAERFKATMAEDPNGMAALWQVRGLAEVETLLAWLFDPDHGNRLSSESPDRDGTDPGTPGARFLREIGSNVAAETDELVRRIASHPSFHLLSRTALTELRWMMIRRDIGPRSPVQELDEPRGYDPEVARRMAQWRNELRARFALPLESVPDLPTRWVTIRGPTNRFSIPDDNNLTLDGSTDSLLYKRTDTDVERTSIHVCSLLTGDEKFSLKLPVNPERAGWSFTTPLTGLIILGRIYEPGLAVADLNKRAVRVVGLKVSPDNQYIRDCVLDRGGVHLLAQLADEIALFRVADGTVLWKRKTSFSEGDLMRFIDEGRKIAIAPDHDSIFVLDTLTGAELARLNGHSAALDAMLTSADGRRLVTLGFDGRINVWDTRELKLIRTIFTFGPARYRTPIALSNDGGRLACALESGESVLLYNLDSAALLGEVRSNPYGGFNEIALSADGDTLVARNGQESLWVNVWDLTPLTKR
jgi:hypothetical protein